MGHLRIVLRAKEGKRGGPMESIQEKKRSEGRSEERFRFFSKRKGFLLIGTLVFLGGFSLQTDAHGTSFFEGDVWRDPDRPFLFYGESPRLEEKKSLKSKEKNAKEVTKGAALSDPFSGALTAKEPFSSMEEIHKERKVRLDRALLHPTEENIASYLAINAYLIEKASVFSTKWRDTLLKYPEFDWTARAPTVNAVSTKLTREKTRETARFLLGLKEDWGLVLFLDASKLSASMAPLAARFASLYEMELLEVAVDSKAKKQFPKARVSFGETRLIGKGGLKLFPALLLLHRKDKSWSDARLVATGVVDVLEIGRRIERIAKAESENPSPDFKGVGKNSFEAAGLFQSGSAKWNPSGETGMHENEFERGALP